MKSVLLLLSLSLYACAGSETSSFLTTDSESAVIETSQHCLLSSAQRTMLKAVNEARASSRYCGNQAMPAVAPLGWNCALDAAAQVHADDMARHEFFSHTGSDGLEVGDRIAAQGYSAVAWAENIAEGYEDASEAVSGFVESPGHCVNIMSPDSREFGAASAVSAAGTWYWTQAFAAR